MKWLIYGLLALGGFALDPWVVVLRSYYVRSSGCIMRTVQTGAAFKLARQVSH
jgi:hypothetical protein